MNFILFAYASTFIRDNVRVEQHGSWFYDNDLRIHFPNTRVHIILSFVITERIVLNGDGQ